jgi:hypothetical protein
MSNPRPHFLDSQHIALVTQVNRICPLCDKELFYKKNGRSFKRYEIAHIYPLNPTPPEAILLQDESRLSTDVNHEDNLIPLCAACHLEFDKPRTVAEYRELYNIKKELIKNASHHVVMSQYQIEEDIRHVIDSLYSTDPFPEAPIAFDLKEIDDKLDGSINNLTKRKIQSNVTDYYLFIKQRFAELDAANPDSASLISAQIKAYYLKQKTTCDSQQEIFKNIVTWINMRTRPKTIEVAEIIASFFVQNCEVFE